MANTSLNNPTDLHGSLEELHRESEIWLSEIEFFHDELRFFENFIDKFFMRLLEDESLSAVQALVNQILHFREHTLAETEKKVKIHNKHLSDLVNDTKDIDEIAFRMEQSTVRGFVQELMKEHKLVKKNVFEVMGKVIKDEKLNHFLKG